jgi:hypothetical protein
MLKKLNQQEFCLAQRFGNIINWQEMKRLGKISLKIESLVQSILFFFRFACLNV